MKNYRLPFLALAIVGALVLGSWPPWPIGAQSTGVVVTTPVVSSTASVGTSGVLTLDGKYSNCTVNAQTSTSTASIVVYGNSQAGQYGPGAPGAVNATFGSGGTITATTTATAFSGNVASLPVGFYFTWSGNSGTLTAWATCTSATGAAVIASVPPVTLITPVPVTQASAPWNVHDSAPVQPSPIYTQPVQQPTPFGATPCPGASIAAAECASPAPYATSVSPAPGNLLARGYNASGAAAPVICTKSLSVTIAATTQSTETVMVPSASGKTTYVCLVLMSAVGTVAGQFGLASSATNTCGSLSNVLPAQVGLAAAPSNVALGTGVGVIASTPSGTALCFFNSTVGQTGTAQATIMYEQFLHSLTPEQYEEFCSLPKRCVLYGLMKHLSNLFDREVDAPLGVRP